MLQLTRLNGPAFALNPDLIERAEATPDTVVTLVNGSKYVIRESVDELIALCRAHRAALVADAQAACPLHVTQDAPVLPDAPTPGRHRPAGATVVPLRADGGEH